MSPRAPRRGRFLAIASAMAGTLALGGCAGAGWLQDDPQAPGHAHDARGQRLGAEAASQLVHPGTSTQADVKAALGQALQARFDSGCEVWVYRWPGRGRSVREATELVLLFSPEGVLQKQRLRPGYPAQG